MLYQSTFASLVILIVRDFCLVLITAIVRCTVVCLSRHMRVYSSSGVWAGQLCKQAHWSLMFVIGRTSLEGGV